MPKSPNPHVPLISLMALANLYRQSKGLPHPNSINESVFVSSLSAALLSDKLLEKENINFVNIFRSKPTETDWQKAPGVSTERLDKIVLHVIDHFNLRKHFNLPEKIEFPWNVFSELIIPTPGYLKALDKKRYFKFLNETERESVEAYLKLKYNELGIGESSVLNYSLYMWNHDYQHVRCAIITIDTSDKLSTYTYFVPTQSGWEIKSSMKSFGYFQGNSTLYLDLIEIDPAKAYIQGRLLITVLDASFPNLPAMKGVLAVAGHNGSVPVGCEIILEKCNSYFEALQKVKTDAAKNPLLCLEVQGKRFDVADANIFSLDRLRTFPLFKILEEIKGYYLMSFINQLGRSDLAGKLNSALVRIDNDGMVYVRFDGMNTFKAYVDQTINRGDNFICINFFLSQLGKELDFQYRLEIERDYKQLGIVTHLIGGYIGFNLGTVYMSEIVFQPLFDPDKKNENGTPKKIEYANFEDALTANAHLLKMFDIQQLTERHIPLLSKAYKLLKSGKHDHNPKP